MIFQVVFAPQCDGHRLSPVVSKRGHNTLYLFLFGWTLVLPLGQELEKAACVLA